MVNLSALVNEPARSRRNVVIDLLRGICLIFMTVDHLPHTALTRLTWQPLGFVSAAEGFVFLSGLVSGLVYGKIVISQGMRLASSHVFKRLRTLYIAQVLFTTLAILAARVGLATLDVGFRPGFPLWLKTVALITGPSFTEILRLYIIFFLVVPLVFLALQRGYLLLIGISSVLFWAIAAYGLGLSALDPVHGYFDPLSWQLLFVIGICLGFPAQRAAERIPNSKPMLAAAGAAILFLFLARHSHGLTGSDASEYFAWLKEWRRTVAFGRLINFAALSYLIFLSRTQLARIAQTLPGQLIAFLGRHSLQVFVWSSFISMIVWAHIPWWNRHTQITQIALQMIAVVSCLLPAFLHKQWQLGRVSGAHSQHLPKLEEAGATH